MPEDVKLWSCTAADSGLMPAGIQVRAAWLEVTDDQRAGLWLILSGQERERAGRFAFERDRARFIAGRGILREMLSNYLSTTPQSIEFVYSAKGKPSLGGEFARSGVQFNVSHSGGLGLFAVAHDRLVGVDVEQIRPVPEMAGLMERFFSERECAEIKKLAGNDELTGFYRIWTRKEAWLKASGEGITVELRSVDVLGATGPHKQAAGFSLHDLAPAPGFVAALAVGE